MKKVIWGATSSGFLLAATLREHFRRTDPTLLQRFGNFFYHDDSLKSSATVDEAISEMNCLITTLASAGMVLAKWKANAGTVAGHLTAQGFESPSLNITGGDALKVLDISWMPQGDDFCFVVRNISELAKSSKSISKRFVLRLVASLFDPLGWLSPSILRGKRIIQKLWSEDLQ